ncbi:11667_t:CDS:2 [Ambispora gerdemannii]|uniref:11667_t:CDS:1 n=1 Tax=Ambispora gerdemannii TaxID=144530 RepID=A0A9N9AJZ2_9GLOM|nr:11667_t:CDS:2 [Ambispora gerdemannii]
MQLFAVMLAFYLWYSTVMHDVRIEEKCFRYASCGIWVINAIMQVASWVSARREKNWGAEPNQLYCKGSNDWLAFMIPSIIVSAIATFFACHSSVLTFRRWRLFRQKQTRGTAIKLGLAVRLCVYSLFYAMISLASYIPRIIQNIPDSEDLTLSEFSGSASGIFLFLTFGTTKSAAVFLPCCYYAPPESQLLSNAMSISNSFASTTHEPDHAIQKVDSNDLNYFVDDADDGDNDAKGDGDDEVGGEEGNENVS